MTRRAAKLLPALLAGLTLWLALCGCNLPLGAPPLATGTPEPGPPRRLLTPIPTATAAASAASPPFLVLPGSWVGREVPPEPPGYPRYSAWMMAPDYHDYAYEFLLSEDGSQGMILFQRFARRSADGKAYFTVVDARDFPALPEGKTFFTGCQVDGAVRDDLIVLGAPDPADPALVIVDRAWQADRASEHILDLEGGWRCALERMGE